MRIREVLQRANELIGQGNYDAAVVLLRQSIDGGEKDSEVRQLLDTVEARIRDREASLRVPNEPGSTDVPSSMAIRADAPLSLFASDPKPAARIIAVQIALVIACLVLIAGVWIFVHSRGGGVSRTAVEPGGTKVQNTVRITMFYVSKASLSHGENALLCYGVENAAAVNLSPPVEHISPAVSRCITITPANTTTYTLQAEDASGKAASQSVTVKVAGPLPQFTDLSISAKEVKVGQLVTFCFKASNASAVTGGPGHFLHGGSPKGDCLVDQPAKTTTYHLSIADSSGQAVSESITVNVIGSGTIERKIEVKP